LLQVVAVEEVVAAVAAAPFSAAAAAGRLFHPAGVEVEMGRAPGDRAVASGFAVATGPGCAVMARVVGALETGAGSVRGSTVGVQVRATGAGMGAAISVGTGGTMRGDRAPRSGSMTGIIMATATG
jgi:hypothetical protein